MIETTQQTEKKGLTVAEVITILQTFPQDFTVRVMQEQTIGWNTTTAFVPASIYDIEVWNGMKTVDIGVPN